MQNCFNLGKIVNTHGIKGEVKIYPYSDNLEKFKTYSYLIVGDKRIDVQTVRVHKNMVLVKFEGYDDANAVQPLLNQMVFLERDQIETEEDEGHYIVDLIGCKIVDQTGNEIGLLKDVIQNRSQDLYEIVRRDNGKVFYLPVVDEFVLAIDVVNKVINVHIIEGIME